jgi:hypothetical protein
LSYFDESGYEKPLSRTKGKRRLAGKRFTLMAYRADDNWPSVRSLAALSPDDVLAVARDLVNAGECDRVEVWCEGERVHTLRPPLLL